VAIRFAIDGDLRFISHHDTMRLFERALSRARIPVKFTEGFNPRAKLSLPLPRPVGVASGAELLVVELTEALDPAAVMGRLANQMPGGLELLGARAIAGKRKCQPEWVEYQVAVPPERVAELADAVDRIRSAQEWEIERDRPGSKPGKVIDLKAFFADASVDSDVLRWAMQVTPAGTARVAEFLLAVGLVPEDWQHRVRRTVVKWAADTSDQAEATTTTEA
jgi:radical SAM-linked protein